MKKHKDLLPWFITNTLSAGETREIEAWLQNNSDARANRDSLQEIAKVIEHQNSAAPSIQVRNKIIANIEKPIKRQNNLRRWIFGVPLAIIFFAIFWLITQPGHQLEWSIQGDQASAFRIYRTSAGQANFELVKEFSATPSQEVYQFADPIVVPGQRYQYLVEVINKDGIISTDQITVDDSLLVFTSQFAILLTSFFLAFGIITLVEEFKGTQLPFATI